MLFLPAFLPLFLHLFFPLWSGGLISLSFSDGARRVTQSIQDSMLVFIST